MVKTCSVTFYILCDSLNDRTAYSTFFIKYKGAGALGASINYVDKFFFGTGWFKANLDTLTNDYDKYNVCTEKIMVVYLDISFDYNKSEKNNIDFITATS